MNYCKAIQVLLFYRSFLRTNSLRISEFIKECLEYYTSLQELQYLFLIENLTRLAMYLHDMTCLMIGAAQKS